jgi:hypothetical protein
MRRCLATFRRKVAREATGNSEPSQIGNSVRHAIHEISGVGSDVDMYATCTSRSGGRFGDGPRVGFDTGWVIVCLAMVRKMSLRSPPSRRTFAAGQSWLPDRRQ